MSTPPLLDFLRFGFIIVPIRPNFNEKLSPADRRTFSILLTNLGEKVSYERFYTDRLGDPIRGECPVATGFFHLRLRKERPYGS
jgi:hypothetical protein